MYIYNFFELPAFLKLANTDPFAPWFVVTGDGIRVVRSVLGAVSSLSIAAFGNCGLVLLLDRPSARQTLHPQPSTLNLQPSTLNLHLSTFNLQL